jgi:hypothetical protein
MLEVKGLKCKYYEANANSKMLLLKNSIASVLVNFIKSF